MPLTIGTRLQHYDIRGALGAGGMGEVYRATDVKLRRDVAIKILPPPFANDPSRLARFEREAHALAALNHPNIAAIHGIEQSDDVRFLVLELVEGPTLAERLASGRIEASEAMRIATQIAEAIEAAHDKGIVHRDLKPANVKLAPDGRVKVLDFGLAKAFGDPEPADLADSPTITGGGTRVGIVLGTAGYMSPEQASGKPVDKRTDVWSFGVLLYEMLTGRKAFEGKTVSHTLVHVMEHEPDWSALPPLPAGVGEMLERCLQKDPTQRLRDIGDVRLLLQSAITRPVQARTATARPSRLRSRLAWVGVAAAVIAVAALAFLYLQPAAPPADPVRFEIAQPGTGTPAGALRVSPDGRKVAFIATGPDNRTLVWVRTLETLEARPVETTRGIVGGTVIWSPDSRSLAFLASQALKRVDTLGGPAQTLASDLSSNFLAGGFWTKDDIIVFANGGSLLQVSAKGGEPRAITNMEGRFLLAPSLLSDGRSFVYSAFAPDEGATVYVGTLDASGNQSTKPLLADGIAEYVSTADSRAGYLLFVRHRRPGDIPGGGGGTLMAAPFDVRTQQIGEAQIVAEDVPSFGFSASDTGVLVYRAGSGRGVLPNVPGTLGQLTWFDRGGRVIGTAGDPGFYTFGVKLSPDDTRVALTRPSDSDQALNFDVWILEFARGTSTRLTSDPVPDVSPVWSPDGSRVTFMSYRPDEKRGGLYEKAANNAGTEEPLITIGERIAPTEWSRDGRFLTYWNGGPTTGDLKLYIAGSSSERKVVPLLNSQFMERGGSFSPDGRWIAYASNETGQNQIYVRAFDPASATATGAQTPVSTKGGAGAKWSRDGKEIFFQAPDGTIMSAQVTTTPTFKAETPQALFKTAVIPFWDVTSDGQRFLIPVPQTEKSVPASFNVVLNWTSTLKR